MNLYIEKMKYLEIILLEFLEFSNKYLKYIHIFTENFF